MISQDRIDKGLWWEKPWGLVSSCTRCSQGCAACWALAMEKRYRKGVEGQIITHPERLSIPLKRKKPTVYAVWNDWAHESISDYFRFDMMDIVLMSPQHTYLFLTKRPQSALDFWGFLETRTTLDYRNELLTHVFRGLTVCTQQEADEKIPIFLRVPGRKFLCLEPLLEPIDLYEAFAANLYAWEEEQAEAAIDAVILGAESLGNRPGREMRIEWAESIADQCQAAGVSLFVKQIHVGGRLVKDMNQFPGKLQRRDLPWK